MNCKGCMHWDQEPLQTGFRTDIPLGPGYKIDWSSSETVIAEQQRRQTARMVELQQQYGVCMGVESIPEPEQEPPVAFTMDGSGYMSSLITRSDFGCILFKARP